MSDARVEYQAALNMLRADEIKLLEGGTWSPICWHRNVSPHIGGRSMCLDCGSTMPDPAEDMRAYINYELGHLLGCIYLNSEWCCAPGCESGPPGPYPDRIKS